MDGELSCAPCTPGLEAAVHVRNDGGEGRPRRGGVGRCDGGSSYTGVPAGAVFDSGDIFNSEHLKHRGMVQVVNHPTRGDVEILGNPIQIDRQPSKLEPAPLLGADTEDVLRTELGLSEVEIAVLRADCAI